jgi:ParB family chromosome partitioning protein
MAIRVGKKRASVTNTLRLLKLPAKLQHDLKVGLLSVGHAKVLLGVEDIRLQEHLCDLVIKEGWSVRQLEDKLHKLMQTKEKEDKVKTQDLPDDYFKVLEIVGKYFESNISLKRTNSGKGTMTIHFNSDSEMSKFLEALENSKL